MPAQKFNLTGLYRIEQGATYQIDVTLTTAAGAVYPLTGATCAAQVRETYESSDKIEFSSQIDITLGKITLTLTATQTSAITYTEGVWDCEVTLSDSTVLRILEGSVKITKEVTK